MLTDCNSNINSNSTILPKPSSDLRPRLADRPCCSAMNAEMPRALAGLPPRKTWSALPATSEAVRLLSHSRRQGLLFCHSCAGRFQMSTHCANRQSSSVIFLLHFAICVFLYTLPQLLDLIFLIFFIILIILFIYYFNHLSSSAQLQVVQLVKHLHQHLVGLVVATVICRINQEIKQDNSYLKISNFGSTRSTASHAGTQSGQTGAESAHLLVVPGRLRPSRSKSARTGSSGEPVFHLASVAPSGLARPADLPARRKRPGQTGPAPVSRPVAPAARSSATRSTCSSLAKRRLLSKPARSRNPDRRSRAAANPARTRHLPGGRSASARSGRSRAGELCKL